MKSKNCEAPCNVILSILFLLPVLGSKYCNHHPVVKSPNSVPFARCHLLHCSSQLHGQKSFMWCCAATEHSPLSTTSRYIPRLIFSVHCLICSCLFRSCQLTRWSRALLDSLIIAHIFNKLSLYYATRRFITAFTTGNQLVLILNHMNPYLLVYLRSISILSSHLRVHLRHGMFPSGLPATTQ
jgi:hypothetical protein